MARLAGSSVSHRMANQSERWIRCYVHTLKNCMKNAMQSCSSDNTLVKVLEDFKALKRIVKDAKGMHGTRNYRLDIYSYRTSKQGLEHII